MPPRSPRDARAQARSTAARRVAVRWPHPRPGRGRCAPARWPCWQHCANSPMRNTPAPGRAHAPARSPAPPRVVALATVRPDRASAPHGPAPARRTTRALQTRPPPQHARRAGRAAESAPATRHRIPRAATGRAASRGASCTMLPSDTVHTTSARQDSGAHRCASGIRPARAARNSTQPAAKPRRSTATTVLHLRSIAPAQR